MFRMAAVAMETVQLFKKNEKNATNAIIQAYRYVVINI